MATKKKLFKDVDIDTLIDKYGPFTKISKQEVQKLLDDGDWRRVFCVMTSGDSVYGSVGFHIVNVEQFYKSSKKMPENLTCDDVWFTDDGGLPAP